MKLIGSFTSPYVRKIKICLLEKQIPFEWLEAVPWNPVEEIARYNPLGKVPILVDDEGRGWTDSPVIAEFLETLNARPRLIPSDPMQAVAVRQTESLADGICDAGVALFLERAREEGERSQKWIERQEKKLDQGINALAAKLEDKTFFHNEQLTLADIAAGVVLDWLDFRLGDYQLRSRHQNLLAFSSRLGQRASFLETYPKA